MPAHEQSSAKLALREKLGHLPLKSIVLFFITLLVAGFLRRGYVLALWIVGWFAFVMVRLIFSVKRKVEERLSDRATRIQILKN